MQQSSKVCIGIKSVHSPNSLRRSVFGLQAAPRRLGQDHGAALSRSSMASRIIDFSRKSVKYNPIRVAFVLCYLNDRYAD